MLGAVNMAARLRIRTRRVCGVTLVELLVTLAIGAVLLAVALPSMRDFIARKRLEGVAQELFTDLRLLKSQQIQSRSGNGTAIGFGSTSDKTCYAVFTKGTNVENCQCALADDVACGPAGIPGLPVLIRQTNIPIDTGVRVTAVTTDPDDPAYLQMLGYNAMPRRNSTLVATVTATNVGEIRVTTNATGAPAICAVSGVFSAIKACTP